VLAIPAAALCAAAFAAPLGAFSIGQETDLAFPLIMRLAVLPLFLFSGTFFPVESLPAFLQPIAWITPLFHGVALSRGLALGTAADEPLAMVLHAFVLLAFAGVGAWAATKTFDRKLVRG
jgi:lipooligosaccharide transport system permease protein